MKRIALPLPLLLVLILFTLLTPASSRAASTQMRQTFARFEQPLAAKIGVTVAGLSLIGLELWWFLYSRPHQK
jgi:plastocyanin domain-containing protein